MKAGSQLQKDIKEILLGPAIVLALAISAAVVMGAVWGVVDWLRNYGSGLNPFPYFDRTAIQVQAFRTYSEGTPAGLIEDLIMWYNSVFRSATRFGSGIGLIAGAFAAIGIAGGETKAGKMAAAVTAGILMGARSGLMLGSSVKIFLIGAGLGVALGLVYGMVSSRSNETPELPVTPLTEI